MKEKIAYAYKDNRIREDQNGNKKMITTVCQFLLFSATKIVQKNEKNITKKRIRGGKDWAERTKSFPEMIIKGEKELMNLFRDREGRRLS